MKGQWLQFRCDTVGVRPLEVLVNEDHVGYVSKDIIKTDPIKRGRPTLKTVIRVGMLRGEVTVHPNDSARVWDWFKKQTVLRYK